MESKRIFLGKRFLGKNFFFEKKRKLRRKMFFYLFLDLFCEDVTLGFVVGV